MIFRPPLAPPKGNGRPGFHESTIRLLRQGMVAGTTFAAIPCSLLSAMPHHISGKTLENNRQRSKEYKYNTPKCFFCQGIKSFLIFNSPNFLKGNFPQATWWLWDYF
jgi:hypothetical protein